jgi:hypothetical protein
VLSFADQPVSDTDMLPDDLFRDRLEQTLIDIEKHAAVIDKAAKIDVVAQPSYWRLAVRPFIPLACPFELMIKEDQTFSLELDGERYENLKIERFELFPALVRAIEKGDAERINTYSTVTDALVAVAMRVLLEPGWDWYGERRLMPESAAEQRATHRYLPYNR